ncbi:AMP-binding protein [Streptomyces sp. NPDC046915]|uniref:AMP-binding protein n=1 Tax=Streptomyces sp. NPDC046915 TaxID=3155257 RepID=UPI003401EC93
MPAHLAPAGSPTQDAGTPHELGPSEGTSAGGGAGAGERRLTVRVRIPSATGTALRSALSQALAAAPVLHGTRAEVRGDGDASELTLSCDTGAADAAAIGLLFAEVDRRLAGTATEEDGPGFRDITQQHEPVPRGGDPARAQRFWAARRAAARTDLLRLADAVPGTGWGPRVRHLDRTMPAGLASRLERLADEAGCDPLDVAQLALTVVLQRVGMAPESLGAACAARDLMGLPDVIGPLTRVVPAGRAVDTAKDARTVLDLTRADRELWAAMVRGPAYGPGDERLEVVLDRAGTPRMPRSWELLHWSYPVGGEMTLSLRRTGTGLSLHAESATPTEEDRFGAVLDLWAALLADLLTRPGTPLAELALLPGDEAERQAALLACDPAGAVGTPAAPDLVARFREHVAARPDAPACRQSTRTWTYRQLSRRTAAVAARLDGLADGAVVAVLSDAEPDLLAALLAISWRGAAFLPLSPQEPATRLRDALVRSGASMLLSGSSAPAVTAPSGCRILELSSVGDTAEELSEPPDRASSAPAYLLRTSGSTGVPKLVAVGRASLNNYLSWAARDLLADGSALPVISSPIFDASFKQTLGPLYAGGCVQLLTAHRLDLPAVRAELSYAAAPVTLNCVPSYFSALLADEEDAGDGPTMRLNRLLLGGEPLSPELLRRIWVRYPSVEVWNLYGPTETTATATAGPMSPAGDIHVGGPVAGAAVAVADEHGAVLPSGVLGEVVIAGPGLAVGYLGEQAGPSPFTTVELAGRVIRVYRTGDLGWLDGDGNLRVSGRRDTQIKLNGWRIDLQEIEQVTRRAPGVREAVVLLDDRAGEPCLRAFVTGAAEAAAVERVLRETLPRPMVPASVTVLHLFDTTATGKVDRTALLARLA